MGDADGDIIAQLRAQRLRVAKLLDAEDEAKASPPPAGPQRPPETDEGRREFWTCRFEALQGNRQRGTP